MADINFILSVLITVECVWVVAEGRSRTLGSELETLGLFYMIEGCSRMLVAVG